MPNRYLHEPLLFLDERVDAGCLAVEVGGEGSLFIERWHWDGQIVQVTLLNTSVERCLRARVQQVLIEIGPASEQIVHEAWFQRRSCAEHAIVRTHRSSAGRDPNTTPDQPHGVDHQVVNLCD